MEMKVLTVEDKVSCVGDEEPTVEAETPKLTKEELNRYIMLDPFGDRGRTRITDYNQAS